MLGKSICHFGSPVGTDFHKCSSPLARHSQKHRVHKAVLLHHADPYDGALVCLPHKVLDKASDLDASRPRTQQQSSCAICPRSIYMRLIMESYAESWWCRIHVCGITPAKPCTMLQRWLERALSPSSTTSLMPSSASALTLSPMFKMPRSFWITL